MGLPQATPILSFDDYLAQEREEAHRHEYLDGQMYAMAGETLEHSTICFNLAALLGGQLRGKPCRGLSPNMKVLSGAYAPGQTKGLFSYPDLSVVCGEPRFHDERRDVLLNPSLIVEVLSPGTELFDRGEKFLRYRTNLASLREYVLVSSQTPMIEIYRRQDDEAWLYSATTGSEGVVALPAIDCELRLTDVYERVEFASPSFPYDDDASERERAF